MPPSRQPQGRELPSVAAWIYSVYQPPLTSKGVQGWPQRGALSMASTCLPQRMSPPTSAPPCGVVWAHPRRGHRTPWPPPLRPPPPRAPHTVVTLAAATAHCGHPRCGHPRRGHRMPWPTPLRSPPLHHHPPPPTATATPPHSGEARVTTLGWASRVSATKTDSLLWQPEREWRVAVAAMVRVVGRSACAGNPEQSSIYDH